MQQIKTVFHWFHGWAGHPDIWQDMIAHTNDLLISRSIEHVMYNRGYYNRDQPTSPVFSQLDTSLRHIIVTHSMGGMFVPKELADVAEHWFMISGFRDFHEVNSSLTRKALSRMIVSFKSEPIAVLRRFQENMMFPDSADLLPYVFTETASELQFTRLMQDLTMLNETIIPYDYLANSAKLTIFHGEQDVIVSPRHAEILCNAYGGVRVLIDDKAGHGIPLTHSAFIVEHMKLS